MSGNRCITGPVESGHSGVAVAEANANAIAAVPDLIDALTRLDEMYNDFGRSTFDITEIRSIIKTALSKAHVKNKNSL